MSLNNRIYFRDHQPSVCSGLELSDRVHATAATSLHFAETGPESQGLADISFQLSTITQTVDLATGYGDDTSINGFLVSVAAITFLSVNDSICYLAPLWEGSSTSKCLRVYGRSRMRCNYCHLVWLIPHRPA